MATNNTYELLETRTLSVRSFNVCQANNLLDLESLLDYYLAHGDFTHFRNLGLKSNLELIKLCEEYMAAKNDAPEMLATKNPAEAITQQDTESIPSPIQQQYLYHFILHQFQSLSARARNCVHYFLDDEVNPTTLYRCFTKRPRPLILEMPKLGKRTKLELIQLANKIIHLSNDITTFDAAKIKQFQFQTWLNLGFSMNNIEPPAIEQSYGEGRLKLFLLIDALIAKHKVFSKAGTHIFQKRFGYYEGIPVQLLHEIGEELGLTRERIRQLANKTTQYFEVCLEKLAALPGSFDHVADYGWELGNDSYFVTPESAQAVSQAENVRFSQRFYTLFLWAQAKGSYQILPLEIKGDEYDLLVKSDLYEAFDFQAFLKDTGRLLPLKIRKTYFINFEEYLSTFLKNEKDRLLFPRLKQICRELLLAQYKETVPFDADGNLSFENHTAVGPILQALAFQLLESENRPMHLNEIYERLKDHPDYPLKGNNIKDHIIDDIDRFIYFGRTSTYGLRKWEAQNKSVKGGTIRKIVEEYLEKFDHPKHIFEITAYVKQYRPNTNEASIYENLRVDSTKNVLPFPGRHWGLSSKNYGIETKLDKPFPNHIHHYILQYLAKNVEVSIEQLMTHFTQTYELAEIPMDAKLETMLQKGLLQISDEGMVQTSNDQ